MSVADYLYFLVFCSIMVFSPGPMTILLMGIGIDGGLKKTLPIQLGASSAYAFSLLIFSVGLTALLQQHQAVLLAIQWIGVLYVLYLAWKQWQKSSVLTADNIRVSNAPMSVLQRYWMGLITGLSNPKTIVMFSTVIPQFSRNAQTQVQDLMLLSVTFLVLQFVSGVTYSYAGHAIQSTMQNPRFHRMIYRVMALLLVIVALMIAKA